MRAVNFFKMSFGLLTFLPNTNAFSWWDQSHQLIGYIAEQNVSNKTKEMVLQLLQVPISYPGSTTLSANTNGFDTAASWPDSIKLISNQPTLFNHDACHYIDLAASKSMMGTWVGENDARSALNSALQTYKVNSVVCLQSAIKSLYNSSQTREQQAIALRFVIHIVGDMVQPLHNVSLVENGMNDKGGNNTYFPTTVAIPTSNGSSSPQTKMHALWDGTLGFFLQFPYNKEIAKTGSFPKSDLALNPYFSEKLQTQKNSQDMFNAVSESNPTIEDWIIEGYRVAVKNVYTDLNQTWGIYSVLRYDIVSTQISKGGYRLAFLLNAIFDPENSTLGFQKLVYGIRDNNTIKPFVLK